MDAAAWMDARKSLYDIESFQLKVADAAVLVEMFAYSKDRDADNFKRACRRTVQMRTHPYKDVPSGNCPSLSQHVVVDLDLDLDHRVTPLDLEPRYTLYDLLCT